ncbi:MAG: TonB-dependent receptor [Ferruginibacter sp.]
MKQFIAFLLIGFYSPIVMAQKNKTISGVIRDIRNTSVQGATVSLWDASDSLSKQVKITDDKGRFEFLNLKNGQFIFSATATGYKEYVSAKLTISDSNVFIRLPVIILLPAENTRLEELVLKSKRPLLTQDIDKTIVNVEAMISSATSNTLELLEKTPGVTVSNTGEISLNGKNGVLVLIDGRATYMSGQDLATYLKSLPGSMLDKIELMDNPPAKYDAAGSAIINIRLKKNKVLGFTGSIATGYSQGVFARNNESINLNYNNKKINLFSNIGYNTDRYYSLDIDERKFYTADGGLNSSVSLVNDQSNRGYGTDIHIGLDYAISPKTTYGFSISMNSNTRNSTLGYTSNSYGGGNVPDSTGMGNTLSYNQRTNWGLNLNLTHKFNDKGHELTADINYLNYRSRGNQVLDNINYTPGNGSINKNEFKYLLPADITIYSAKADYIHPMKNKSSWEAGIKASEVTNDNDSRYFNVAGNINTPDYSKSNHFIYHENIYAAYINTRKTWKRLGLQLGLRMESTRQNGSQLGNIITAGSSFSKSYTGVFPAVFISYKLDSLGSNTLTTSIARRINRPNYQQLNPFIFYRDNYSYTSGNPLIGPQYQYRLEVKYQHKQYFGFSLQFNRSRDMIVQTTQSVNDIFITRPENLSSGYLFVLASNLSLNPAKWWSINANLAVGHLELSGRVYSEKLSQSINSYRLNAINQFNFSKTWSAELSAFYSGKDIQGQAIVDPRYRVLAAAQKKVLKDKGSIRIIAEDIFHSWIQKDRSTGIKQALSYHTGEWDTQRFGIAFSWRFGNDTFARKRRQTENAAEQEKGRVE